jgi:MoaA/NifB/PqqE/SkfB family radical SAM enzyme
MASSLIQGMNEQIYVLDTDMSTTPFQTYVAEVDEFCSDYVHEAARYLGDMPAKLLFLKITNLLIAKYEFTHRHVELISHPVGLLVDPSNGCGLRCPGCVHSGKTPIWDWQSAILKENVFRDFLNQHGPFAVEIYLANYGEPLLSALTPRLIKYARELGLPTFTSSSLSVPPRMLDGLVESGLNFLICSIDGATEEVYRRYRRGGDFESVIRNIKSLVATKRKLGSYTPVLHWQFLVFEHNRHEVEAVEQLARRLGVNELALVRPFSVTWDDASIHACEEWTSKTIIFDRDRQAHKRHLSNMYIESAKDTIDRHFDVTWTQRMASLTITAPAPRKSRRANEGPKPCNWLYKSLTMDARGRIMPCARPPTKDGDLVFSEHTSPNQFNSRMHKLARQMFADEAVYNQQIRVPNAPDPYCTKCEHRDQKADIDTKETIRRLLDDVAIYELLDERAKLALTDW